MGREILEKLLARRHIPFPRISQTPRQLLQFGRGPRDSIDREVGHNPEPVLDHAKEPVRVAQGLIFHVGKDPLVVKGIQSPHRVRLLEGRSIFALKLLQTLHDELDLDDAARAELLVEVRTPLYTLLLHPVAHGIDSPGEILGDRLLVDEFSHQTADPPP